MTMPDISNIPESRRIYREAKNTQFFEAFERLGKVSLAVREVGIQPASCYQWLVTAGIEAKQCGRARRAEYFRLRESGAARPDSARQVELNLRTAVDWDLRNRTRQQSPRQGSRRRGQRLWDSGRSV